MQELSVNFMSSESENISALRAVSQNQGILNVFSNNPPGFPVFSQWTGYLSHVK